MRCETFQRAYGQSMPQPPATGALLTNIVVHAVIGVDGKVHEAAVESSERPDLNADAIKVVQGWTFTPSLCNGKPNPQEANLVVHFQGR
jgi:TonB family protein